MGDIPPGVNFYGYRFEDCRGKKRPPQYKFRSMQKTMIELKKNLRNLDRVVSADILNGANRPSPAMSRRILMETLEQWAACRLRGSREINEEGACD